MARAQVAGHPFFGNDRVSRVFGELSGAFFLGLLTSGHSGVIARVFRTEGSGGRLDYPLSPVFI